MPKNYNSQMAKDLSAFDRNYLTDFISALSILSNCSIV